jgi:Glycosyl transferases group 1
VKSLVLSTSTNETTKYSDGLKRFGEVLLLSYDQLGHSESLMMSRAKEYAPDFVVYIGQRWGMQPSIAALARLNSSVAPMVHICSDAADPPWWALLQEYHYAGAFSLQVAIDGSHKWPLAGSQMTALTPVDPATFPPFKPHAERSVVCGYAGNPGSGNGSKRTGMLSALLEKKLIDLRIRSNLPFTYEAYCEYLGKARMSLNIAWSGTEATCQVKGRVVESGLAGCCLLETAGAPTSEWFRPGLDYLEYKDQFEAEQIIRRLENEPEATQAIGEALRARVLAEHTPEKFWNRIFERIGLKVAA